MMWMEYVPGQTLHQILGDDDSPQPMSLDQVLKWLHEIAEGLAYMHMQDPPCIHGDLKLDNVLIRPRTWSQACRFWTKPTYRESVCRHRRCGCVALSGTGSDWPFNRGPWQPKAVETLEETIEEIIVEMSLRKLPLLPDSGSGSL